MAGYDLVQVVPDAHAVGCPCRTCKPQRVIARRCRVCGAEFDGPMGDEAVRVATEALAAHLESHTREQIIRVYALGEPWWKVMSDG